ncbi:MAG TPA: uroporphyrinogen decarboxylase family protein [Desulfobacterales bacterium]|nr:uroporphyrinogen decarboxylase family protein [Desulfobacterales bacterium]
MNASTGMSKRERLQALAAGQAVDRPAVALWRHFPGDDARPDDLAAAHLWWQRTFDWDLLKVTPSSSYCVHDWGMQAVWQGGDEGTWAYQNHAIQQPEDWARLAVLDPAAGALGQARQAVAAVCQALGPDTPVLMTIFSPLAQAKNLAGPRLLPHLRKAPGAVLAGLETIAQSIVRYVEALSDTGIAGIFYAVQLAEPGRLSRAEYEQFGQPLDLRILHAAGGYWFNMLHAHGLEVYFDLLAGYPVQASNWHDREGGPSLAEGGALFPGALSGGLDRRTVHLGAPADVGREAADAIAQTQGRRLILSTGCVSMTNSPLSNLWAARRSVEGMAG